MSNTYLERLLTLKGDIQFTHKMMALTTYEHNWSREHAGYEKNMEFLHEKLRILLEEIKERFSYFFLQEDLKLPYYNSSAIFVFIHKLEAIVRGIRDDD